MESNARKFSRVAVAVVALLLMAVMAEDPTPAEKSAEKMQAFSAKVQKVAADRKHLAEAEKALQELEDALDDFDRRVAAILNDFRSGNYCSECGSTKSQIESGGESFNDHLRRVKGHSMPVPESKLQDMKQKFRDQAEPSRESVKDLREDIAATRSRLRTSNMDLRLTANEATQAVASEINSAMDYFERERRRAEKNIEMYQNDPTRFDLLVAEERKYNDLIDKQTQWNAAMEKARSSDRDNLARFIQEQGLSVPEWEIGMRTAMRLTRRPPAKRPISERPQQVERPAGRATTLPQPTEPRLTPPPISQTPSSTADDSRVERNKTKLRSAMDDLVSSAMKYINDQRVIDTAIDFVTNAVNPQIEAPDAADIATKGAAVGITEELANDRQRDAHSRHLFGASYDELDQSQRGAVLDRMSPQVFTESWFRGPQRALEWFEKLIAPAIAPTENGQDQ